MKKYMIPLLLTAAPIFAGEVAPVMTPAPAPCDCPQGWTVGLEVLALKPYQSEGYYDGDFDAGFRGSIGYDFGDCLFVKATGFGYDTDFDETDSTDTIDLSTAFIDLSVGQTFNPSGNLSLSPYVGLCWAKFDETWNNSRGSTYEYDFDGLGVVIGIDGTRSLGNNLSIYGKAKQSVVFGSTDYTYTGDGSNTDKSDNVAFVSELGLGLQYDFTFSNIAANIRAGVEGQWWGGVSDGDSESMGLGGFVLGANFRF